MLEVINHHRQTIAALRVQFGIARLGIFGSSATPTYVSATSDVEVDVEIDFTDAGGARAFDNYFGLKEALAALLGREIDLITRASISNPIFLREVNATTEVIYAQAA